MNTCAILVAAGAGTRMGGGASKTLTRVSGVPAVRRAAEALLAAAGVVIAVIRPEEREQFEEALRGLPVLFAAGGAYRRQSVENGLRLVPEECDVVLVHDGARPMPSPRLVLSVAEGAEKWGACVPALAVTDTIKRAEGDEIVATVDRETLRAVQTPQGFRKVLLRNAYAAADDMATDDAGLVEKLGVRVRTVPGEKTNIKLTTPEDVLEAERILAPAPACSLPLVGMGYDVHRLTEGRELILLGVNVPHEKGLLGHSDADVAAHALMDALLGACALGDIGRHFPDSDETFKGADSMALMGEVRRILAKNGFIPYNVDITIAAQRPKLAPYIDVMRENTARALMMDVRRVSVKATTTEHLGFEGRGEGISATAAALVIQK